MYKYRYSTCFCLSQDFDSDSAKLGPIVSNAVITSNGQLTPPFRYISDLRRSQAPPKADFSGVDRRVRRNYSVDADVAVGAAGDYVSNFLASRSSSLAPATSPAPSLST